MSEQHGREEILSLMHNVEVATVATSAGDKLRVRMMHYATDDDFNIYLASMKGDPKTVQMTHHPSISLLVNRTGAEINESAEVEITGKGVFVTDHMEREHALAMTAERSPVVKHLTETGSGDMLDCIKVIPDTIKYRIFAEIVQGIPPTVIEFDQNRQVVSDLHLIKMKITTVRLRIKL